MQPKLLSKLAMSIATLSGSVLFVTLLLSFIPKNSIQGSPALLAENIALLSNQKQTSVESSASPVGGPARLKIPAIYVDSAVVPVGLAPDGAMDAPKDPAEAAWFNLGSRPGEKGTAVIAGHYGWGNNMPAVFDNLYKLGIGDKVFIEDEKGLTAIFVVREIRIYGKDEAAPEVFNSSDGKSRLNLITCAGDWNKTEQTRSERLVVFADKE